MPTTQLSEKKQTGIGTYLCVPAVKQNIENIVGSGNATRFISSVVSAVQTNKALAECTNSSILSAALLGEALKLTPSPQLGQFYLVPYKNGGISEATFQLGWKGYIQLAIRSGQYRKIVASAVKEGELNDYNPITEDFSVTPITDEKARQKAKVIGYYAMFELTNGFRKEIYWSREKMQSHAETYSNGYKSDLRNKTAYTFWSKDFDAMALKTMLRQLISKWGIMSIDMQKAYHSDMGVLDEDGSVRYVDNPSENVEEVVAEEIAANANVTPFDDDEIVMDQAK